MTVADQMKEIEKLRTKGLKEKLAELTGKATKSNNRPYLLRQIAKALEAKAAAEVRPARKTNAKKKERDQRLPAPGAVLEREHNGKTIRAKVLDDGFEYRGKVYRSLSAVAREATKTTWNGFLFFKLIPYASRRQDEAEGRAS